MDARANDSPTLADGRQCPGHQISDSRENDRRVEWLRRQFVGSPGPGGAEAPGESLGGSISGTRECEYRSPLPLCDLGNNMGGCAEAIESQFLAVAGDHQRTPANQAGAEQRGERHVAAGFTEWKRKARIGDRSCREASVPSIASEERMIAEVFMMS